MTLGDFLSACSNSDLLVTVVSGAGNDSSVIATLSPGTVGVLSATASAYTISNFQVSGSKAITVGVSTGET